MNVYSNAKGEEITGTDAQAEAYRYKWLCYLCEFSIARGRLDAAEQIADNFPESRKRIEYLDQIQKSYETKKDTSNVERLGQKLAGIREEVRLGWDQTNPGREKAVNAWADAAAKLNGFQSINNLQAYVSETLKKSSESAPSGLASAAKELSSGLIRIRALEKIYR